MYHNRLGELTLTHQSKRVTSFSELCKLVGIIFVRQVVYIAVKFFTFTKSLVDLKDVNWIRRVDQE